MNSDIFAASIVSASVLIGLAAAVNSLPELGFEADRSLEQLEAEEDHNHSHSGNESDFVYGSAHEHALFYVVVNRKELDFTDQKFQLNSRYVHLESNKSDIVHKHAEGVTWDYFLDTINTSVEANGSEVCVDLPDRVFCNSGKVVMNGVEDPDLESEISQGDSFVIVLGENATSLAEKYLKRQLPDLYKPPENHGRRA